MKANLDRDVRLGIFEKVDINSPGKWLSRMIDTLKKDGSPRQIIDYKKLNHALPRPTNITQSLFFCPSAYPPGKKKTLLDAKDVYHSVALAKGENREVTKFLCKFSCDRGVGSGQGLIWLNSGPVDNRPSTNWLN